jgi:hypothetical protein
LQREGEVKKTEIQGSINSFDDAFKGMLFTGHLTIFAIPFFLNDSNPEIGKEIEETYPSSCYTNFHWWFIVFLELHTVENRVCG